MNKSDYIIIFLSFQVLIMGIALNRAFYRVGFLEGQLHVQQEFDKAIQDATGPR